jgi:hypothetical protein
MEWAADAKFEDHASFVFLNRRLPVPKFESDNDANGPSKKLTLETDALILSYKPSGDGHFTSGNLSITLKKVDGEQVTWHPGLTDPENLQGTTRTLDGALGSKTDEPIEPGLVSPGPGSSNAPPASVKTSTSSATVTTTAKLSAIMSASPAAFLCRRALPSARGGRATGTTAIRSSTISYAAFTRTTSRSMFSSSTWAGT